MPLLLSNYYVLSEEWVSCHCISGVSNTFPLLLMKKKNYPTQAMSIMLLQALTFVENLKKCVEDN